MAGTLTKSEVRDVYGANASRYDLWATLTESRARRRVLELAAIRDGETILEVAVGTGLLFLDVLERNPHGRTEGIDLTEAMLAQARAKAERSGATNWCLRGGDAYALAYADDSFDLLLNCYMFDLLPEADFGQVLGEFRRVLRPGGRLMLATLACTRRPTYRLWELLYRVNPAWVGGCRGVHLPGPLAQTGFTVETCEPVSQLTFVSEVIRARKPA
jgi:ubiquinone/menaquinone biosynthesis C-methylase UbiE